MSVQATSSPRRPVTTSRPSSRHHPSTPSTRTSQTSNAVSTPLASFLSPNHPRTPSQTMTTAQAQSPNYFGFQVANSAYPTDTTQHTRQNWDAPSSAVRSTAAYSPTVVPVDQNPEFAAFRRQSEGASRTFSLGSLHQFQQSPGPISQAEDGASEGLGPRSQQDYSSMPPPIRPNTNFLDADTANIGRSPKRHLSSDSSTFPPPPRKMSPTTYASNENAPATSNLRSGSPDRHPRTSLPPFTPPSFSLPKHRAETVPAYSGPESSLVTPQHVVNLLQANEEDVLILDIRVSTHYARSRVRGALNLCIPTTLLKRPSFNVQKLSETFKNEGQRRKFERWRNSRYIVVYDASAAQLKDATICLTTIKKFASEGYEGTLYIMRGGFAEFSDVFPQYIDRGSSTYPGAGPMQISLKAPDGKTLPPVIGGCPMPATKSAANPFFGNIRQNMDLIGGVGQMPVKKPGDLDADMADDVPSWLHAASDEHDKGAKVSDKFLHIEKREQKRMQDALSGNVSYGTPSVEQVPRGVQIAGIEKGAKNRYNNIWPFEHTRVKLQGVPKHECDYVNANHIKSSLSNKRYIATQGPIPHTFADFWNVIWQQDVRVIVMLTAEKEGGQIKAHKYWGDQGYGPFAIQQLSERRASIEPSKIYRHRRRPSAGRRKSSFEAAPALARFDSKEAVDEPYVTVRRLTLAHEDFPFDRRREITQLQYSSWPDFGAPAHPAHLLGLVEQCDAVVRATTGIKHSEPDPPESRPVLVHCSAGCGRTGTFCTVDSVIDMLKRQRKAKQQRKRQGTPMDVDSRSDSPFFPGSNNESIDGPWMYREDEDLVEKTVEAFRHQRLSMVQSLRQFVLCYETVLEWLLEQHRQEIEA